VLILLAIPLLILLPSPWNLVAFLVLVPLWVLELLGWNRTVKRRRRVVGAQTLIDKEAVAISPCAPDGQVRVDGEIWQARCAAGARTGDRLRVIARDGLTLIVEPAPAVGAAPSISSAG